MRSTLLKLLAGVSMLSVTALGAVSAGASSASTTITGGNTVQSAPYLDTYSNFYIVDTNNPISGNGLLTGWSFWAGASGTVSLVVVSSDAAYPGGATVLYQSAPYTIQSNQVGSAVTVSIPGGAWVSAGDYVGLYFGGTGVVPYSGYAAGGSSGAVLYTASNVGTSNALAFQGATPRTYSFNVSGLSGGAGCKDMGYVGAFPNQGVCVSAFATHGDVPIGAPGH